jgi:hypothetical protein
MLYVIYNKPKSSLTVAIAGFQCIEVDSFVKVVLFLFDYSSILYRYYKSAFYPMQLHLSESYDNQPQICKYYKNQLLTYLRLG